MKSKKTKIAKCVCIMPFYNEKKTVLDVLGNLLEIKKIDRVIAVDDGSTDGSTALIKSKFPQVLLVTSGKNEGKSEAIKRGLKYVKSDEEYVFLIDADLKNISKKEIERGVEYILEDTSIDMLIFKRSQDPFVSKIIRSDILFSGDRILKTSDLKNVYKTNPKGFQIEVAINLYMMEHGKKSCWVVSTASTPIKSRKRGIARGVSQDLEMYVSILSFMNYKKHIESILTFCAQEYRPGQKQPNTTAQILVYAYVNAVLKRLLTKKNYFNTLFKDSMAKEKK